MNVELVVEFGDDYTYINYNNRTYKEASFVAFVKKGRNIKLQAFGESAKKMLGKSDSSVFIEKPFKAGMIDNMELAQIYLNSFIDKVITHKNFATKIKAVFVVNCALELEEKRAYEVLAIKCGINQIWFIPSSVAVSVGAGLDISKPDGRLMVGIGAGTTEIACISQNSIVNGYTIELGGSVIDMALIDTINDKFGVVVSTLTAEKIKSEIGSLHPTDIANTEFGGIDALTRGSRVGTVFAKDLYEVFSIAYEKICEAIGIVISELSADLINDISRDGIYVYGSGSRVTDLESFLRKRLDVPVNILDDETFGVKGACAIFEDKKLLNEIVEKN